MIAIPLWRWEHKRCRAMIEAGAATLSGLFTDYLLWIPAAARPGTRQGLLESIETDKAKNQATDCSEESVRCYGQVALVSGIADIKAQIAGEDCVLQNRFTFAWTHIDGAWKVINWQSTTVRKPT